MPKTTGEFTKSKLGRRIIRKAVMISSKAVIEDDPVKIAKLSMALSLLSIAASYSEGKDINRLLSTSDSLISA